MNVTPLFRNGLNLVNRHLVRQYAFKSDLKIKWVRPEKIPCYKPEKSGDCSKLPELKENTLIRGFEKSKELETADENVKSLYELRNNLYYHTSLTFREKMIREVQRHPLDFGSMEARLARMTASIRLYQDYMEKNPRDKKRKVMLKELIDKRKKFLKYLRRWDYKRFEWILEKLDLVYKPHPPKYHWITRKESLQKLTDIHCEELRQQKLSEYRKTLEEQQIPFLEDAIKKMAFVRQEQIDLDIPVTVTDEEIEESKKKLTELKQLREEMQKAAKDTEI